MNAQLQPIETAPKDGRYILLAGPSGYTGTPLRFEACRYTGDFRPRQPWVNHANDSFMDGGEAPTYWMPLPELPPKRQEECPMCGSREIMAKVSHFFVALGKDGKPICPLREIVDVSTKITRSRICENCDHEWDVDPI